MSTLSVPASVPPAAEDCEQLRKAFQGTSFPFLLLLGVFSVSDLPIGARVRVLGSFGGNPKAQPISVRSLVLGRMGHERGVEEDVAAHTLTLHIPLLGGTQTPAVPARPARYDFLNSKPPPNFVAGLGRGATGFTTRSNIGPARAAPDLPDRSATRFESFVPVPDTLLEKVRQEQEHVTALDPKTRAAGGTETPWSQTPVTDLTAAGEGRGTVLSLKLDRLSDSVSGLTVVDPKGYLTDLKGMKITSEAEISDIKKARLLLKSVTQTNPKHPPGWIAAARLEEVAGKIQAARQLIQKGCEECPKNEDVWLEACRLASPDEAKAVIARGVKAIPNLVKLWLQAAKLEQSDLNRSRVLRKGLDSVPNQEEHLAQGSSA